MSQWEKKSLKVESKVPLGGLDMKEESAENQGSLVLARRRW